MSSLLSRAGPARSIRGTARKAGVRSYQASPQAASDTKRSIDRRQNSASPTNAHLTGGTDVIDQRTAAASAMEEHCQAHPIVSALIRGKCRQINVEACTFTERACDLDSTIVPLDNAMNDRKP